MSNATDLTAPSNLVSYGTGTAMTLSSVVMEMPWVTIACTCLTVGVPQLFSWLRSRQRSRDLAKIRVLENELAVLKAERERRIDGE